MDKFSVSSSPTVMLLEDWRKTQKPGGNPQRTERICDIFHRCSVRFFIFLKPFSECLCTVDGNMVTLEIFHMSVCAHWNISCVSHLVGVLLKTLLHTKIPAKTKGMLMALNSSSVFSSGAWQAFSFFLFNQFGFRVHNCKWCNPSLFFCVSFSLSSPFDRQAYMPRLVQENVRATHK